MTEIRALLPRGALSPKIRFRAMHHDIVVSIDRTCVLSILSELLSLGHEGGLAASRRFHRTVDWLLHVAERFRLSAFRDICDLTALSGRVGGSDFTRLRSGPRGPLGRCVRRLRGVVSHPCRITSTFRLRTLWDISAPAIFVD